MVETLCDISAGNMPFPALVGVVTIFVQPLSQVRHGWNHVGTVSYYSVFGCVAPGKPTRTRWTADWIGTIGFCKADTSCCKPVHTGCLHVIAPQMSKGFRAVLVGCNQKDIWSLFHRL